MNVCSLSIFSNTTARTNDDIICSCRWQMCWNRKFDVLKLLLSLFSFPFYVLIQWCLWSGVSKRSYSGLPAHSPHLCFSAPLRLHFIPLVSSVCVSVQFFFLLFCWVGLIPLFILNKSSASDLPTRLLPCVSVRPLLLSAWQTLLANVPTSC